MQKDSLFFYAACDPPGFVSSDKPPVAAWVQAAFAKGLGFGSVSLLLPEALAGRAGPMGLAAGPRTGRGGGWMGMRAPNVGWLVAFIEANHQGERIMLAAAGSQPISPIIIQTGHPVIAMGGFMGADPALPFADFGRLVDERQLRFVLLPDSPRFGRDANPERTETVRATCCPVEPSLWRPDSPPPPAPPSDIAEGPDPTMLRRMGGFMGMLQLYDCASRP